MTDSDAPDDAGHDPDHRDGRDDRGGERTTAADADRSDADRSDDERRELLRAVADDVRGESSESRQVAAILYRVSDLYDPGEDTSPEEIYLNVRNIVNVKERGGLRRERTEE
ncbi:hypothetical protein [Candidatus Halobonum tyrrellensis]|uniref:Uncharacterized protein n=1 Tax=Candidatus Halobonum tyrrellensis G22 TaxID=1324957 RepID=V4HEF7_9EURY|nr:hypothetical protein [Candidatus Halobonum tyrrellensis]ESP89085.1 hypothetical protein K933_05758 [Candidatus Halobonum tyrrellensis G22]